ncbi:hypothetical protein SPAN111604_01465 [Sphingomonas antarctica]|uniref:DUF2490 domain-containing protein n=1 Tax=Sphingomonas antarctica TaxID=2040274 RepID=UPI0039E980F1
MRCFPIMLLFCAAPACAADQDAQLWTVFSASGSLHKQLVGSFDGVVRASHDQHGVASAEGTTMLGWRFSSHATLFAGFGLSRLHTSRGEATLHRGRQQLTLALGKIGGTTVGARTMIEERRWLGLGGTAVRLREQVRVTHPLIGKHTGLFVTAEPIWNLNSTVWGQRAGLNRLRSSAGLSFTIARRLRGEIGYLNDYDFRPRRADREIHAALTSLVLTF